MKIMEKEKMSRVEKLKKMRKRKVRNGLIFGDGVIGIYL
jgi:hypothetical protein